MKCRGSSSLKRWEGRIEEVARITGVGGVGENVHNNEEWWGGSGRGNSGKEDRGAPEVKLDLRNSE